MRRGSYHKHIFETDTEQVLNIAAGVVNGVIRNGIGYRPVGVDALAKREAIFV
jgi:hypothetical protein